jgi:sugar O-acyltransferase (sialic acid O-acetyltransferase NeuD family)
MKKVILIGAGGHAHSLIEVIESSVMYEIKGIVVNDKDIVGEVLGYPVIGNDNDLPELVHKDMNFVIAVGQIKTSEIRQRLFNYLKKELGANFPVVKASTAYISNHSQVGCGTVVLHGAVVNAKSKIGENSIINSLSLIEHDVVIGNHVHVATGAIVNGGVSIGDGTFIGSGVIIRQGVKIGANCFIQAGSVILEDVSSSRTVNLGKA